jgi:hypothetical protein
MATRLVTVDEVVAEAASIIKGASDQERHLMRQWAYSGNAEIGVSKLNMKVSAPLLLDDFSAAKPVDHVRTIDLALYDSAGSEIIIQWKGFGANMGYDTGIARTHKDVRVGTVMISVTEDLDFFHTEEFGGDYVDGAYIITKYYGTPVDVNGLPLIASSSKFAVMMYIRYMWQLRNNDSITALRDGEKRWRIARAAAESKLKTPDVIEGKEIAKKANSMIQKVMVLNRQF